MLDPDEEKDPVALLTPKGRELIADIAARCGVK
jgi:hypothetical protein